MTVEILPPMPKSGHRRPEDGQSGFSPGHPTGGWKIIRMPPLLVGLLLIPLFLIALPFLLIGGLIFGFRLWRRMAAMSGLMAASRGTRLDASNENNR